jgi:hypothetical protein
MEDIKFFKIYLEDSIICTIKCARSETLDNLRKKISLKASISDFLFTLDNEPIKIQNEKNFSIDDIAKENPVKLISNKSKNITKENDIKLVCNNNEAIPIPGSIEKSKIDNTIIYSYPEYKLTEIEKS